METQKIGLRIAEARKKINLSQNELAQRLFISPQAVSKWERGESMPDITSFIRLAEVLGVDLNYFSGNPESQVAEKTSPESAENNPSSLSEEAPVDMPKKKISWDMSRGNWADADFSGLKNLHERFSSSNMQRCRFVGSDMKGLLLKSNNVGTCDFSGSDFTGSHIQTSNLMNNNFAGCRLSETKFTGSNITGCDFTDADLTDVAFKSSGLDKNTVTNAVLNRTSFYNTSLANMVFEGYIEECSFENCGFAKVKFQNARLINTFFKNNRKLKKVEFINCQADRITFAFLKSNQADVSGISLIE